MPTTLTFSSLQDDVRRYLERGWTAASDPEVWEQIPRLINNAERDLATQLKVQGFIENVTMYFTAGLEVYPKPDRWREWISVNYGTSEQVLATTTREAVVGTRTLTLEKPHGYAVGDQVLVSGVGGVGYDTGTGVVPLTAVTQLGLTYIQGADTEVLTADTGGLVTVALNKRKQLLSRSYEYLRAYWPNSDEVGDPLYYADYQYYYWLVAPTPRLPAPVELNYYQQPPLLDDSNQTNWLTDLQPNLLLFRTLVLAAPYLKNEERLQTWQGLFAEQAQAITGQDLDKIRDRTSSRDKP